MPARTVKAFAKEAGKTVKAVDRFWDKAEKIASAKFPNDDDDRKWQYVTGILRRMLKLKKEAYTPTTAQAVIEAVSAVKSNWDKYRDGKNSAERGYGYQWRKVRDEVLERDNHKCQVCNAKATQVDHIKSRQDGGDDSAGNLRSICDDCHNHKTASKDSKDSK